MSDPSPSHKYPGLGANYHTPEVLNYDPTETEETTPLVTGKNIVAPVQTDEGVVLNNNAIAASISSDVLKGEKNDVEKPHGENNTKKDLPKTSTFTGIAIMIGYVVSCCLSHSFQKARSAKVMFQTFWSPGRKCHF